MIKKTGQMSEATSTNGPWEVLGRQIYDVSDPFPIASITGVKRPPEERDANGWLIAAAPDILESLEQMVLDFKELGLSGDGGYYIAEDQPIYQRAVAAILKAKGVLLKQCNLNMTE